VSANLDLVRSIYAGWERGDFFSSVEWAHPKIEFVARDGPEPGCSTGSAAMVEAWRDVMSAWEGLRPQMDECRELDDERVLVLFYYSGRGKTSGLELGEMRTRGANVFHVREGKVIRLVLYWDRDRALADLGLAAEGEAS
jgi:ketosteroid isomerase-like protein